MEAIVIGAIRVAGSLPVLRWAFVGGLIAVFTDLSDLFLRQLIDLGGLPNYQEWDKWVDQVYILLFLVAALWREGWTGWERRIAIGTFAWRAVGLAAFMAGGGRDVLIFFPHVFEFWFLYVASRRHWPRRWVARDAAGEPEPLSGRSAAGWLLFLTGLKVFHEYTLHTGRWFDDFTATEAVEAVWEFLSGPFAVTPLW